MTIAPKPPRSAARIVLLGSTALTSAPYPRRNDYAGDRVAVGRAVLGRAPHVLTNPYTDEVVWVESEPEDWRDLFDQVDAAHLATIARRDAARQCQAEK